MVKPLLPAFTPLVNILPPTPPLTIPVIPSMAPMVKPLPADLKRRSLISSGFSNTVRISSLLSGLPPLAITFSLSNSANVAAVSIAVIAPAKAPETAPPPAPMAPVKKARGPPTLPAAAPNKAPLCAPIAAPPPAKAAASSESNTVPTAPIILDITVSTPKVGFCIKALKPAQAPLSPSSLYLLVSICHS